MRDAHSSPQLAQRIRSCVVVRSQLGCGRTRSAAPSAGFPRPPGADRVEQCLSLAYTSVTLAADGRGAEAACR